MMMKIFSLGSVFSENGNFLQLKSSSGAREERCIKILRFTAASQCFSLLHSLSRRFLFGNQDLG
jgi:hypothetical protein